MQTTRLIVGICFLLASSWAVAECTSKWCSDVYVDTLFVRANGDISVATSGTETLLNCTAYQGVYTTLQQSAANSDDIYALLLAAYMADKKVLVRIVEGSSNCEISYARVDRE